MLILLLFLAYSWLSEQSEDFENAKIFGFPRIVCSKRSLTFDIDTNIPFQGRISVMKKIHRQACVQDYSENIQRNATFKVELQHCMELTYMNNGSRIFSAQIEVGFHPLVITSNDRLFSVRCIDNSHVVSHLTAKKEDNYCTHTVRLASRWESGTIFHVGDAVVHEWNCNFSSKDDQKYQTFLTNCNVLSNSGQLIHLVDENGCIVDSELMEEIVYNNFMPKIFARARIFRLINDEKYRIECQVQMCTTDGVCKDRIFPPKCAFTKEEILSRYMAKPKADSIEDTIMTGILTWITRTYHTIHQRLGTINNRYERQVKVASEWITVHNNQYTNIEQLHERFYLSTIMDDKMEEPEIEQPVRHFLMGISYRNPNENETTEKNESSENGTLTALIHPSPSFRPDSPLTDLSETDDADEMNASGLSLPFVGDAVPLVVESESSSIRSTTQEKRNENPSTVKEKTKQLSTKYLPTATTQSATSSNETSVKLKTKLNSTITTQNQKDTSLFASTATAAMTISKSPSKKSAWRGSRSSTVKPSPKGNTIEGPAQDLERNRETPATLHFYGTKSTTMPTTSAMQSQKTLGNPYHLLSEAFLTGNKIFRENVGVEKTKNITTDSELSVSSSGDSDLNAVIKEKFANLRDWRLDDRTINDTDILPERQISCSNATIIASQRKCTWSGIEHLLVVWSFASLLVWIVMIAVCFYRQANKPTWVEFRILTKSSPRHYHHIVRDPLPPDRAENVSYGVWRSHEFFNTIIPGFTQTLLKKLEVKIRMN